MSMIYIWHNINANILPVQQHHIMTRIIDYRYFYDDVSIADYTPMSVHAT